eukprot:scaffold263841_cov18-Tisochrysis_lutea.AAC.1
MDARGDYVACCGYSMRGSHAQPDAYMKVSVGAAFGGLCAAGCIHEGGFEYSMWGSHARRMLHEVHELLVLTTIASFANNMLVYPNSAPMLVDFFVGSCSCSTLFPPIWGATFVSGLIHAQVFDMRNLGGSTLKPMLTLPFPNISGAPTSLSFHPKMHSLLLVGSGRGGLNMVDIAKGTSISTHQ